MADPFLDSVTSMGHLEFPDGHCPGYADKTALDDRTQLGGADHPENSSLLPVFFDHVSGMMLVEHS